MRLAFLVAAMCAWTSAGLAEEDRSSGALFLGHCKSLLTSPQSTFMEGMCLGMLAGIAGVARGLPAEVRSCQPPGNPYPQLVGVVVCFLEAHPERQSEKFGSLALAAFKEAYPCP
jgi:hypothetical protein